MTLIFSSIVYPTESSQKNGYLLASSLREFGGSMSNNPILYYIPNMGKGLNESIENKFRDLDVEIIPFDTESLDIKFPFLGHAYAASLAEKEANERSQNIVWIAPNTIILTEPAEMNLSQNKILGYRPVHHKLIGSDYSQPKDDFWNVVYDFCEITDDDAFPMTTHIDAELIRPYFNAGFLIVNPKRKILRRWYTKYSEAYLDEQFAKFYNIDDTYEIFIHQAILSGVILKLVTSEDMVELNSRYNYPLHLFTEDITPQKPELIDDCITIRHEGFYKNSNWEKQIPASSSLKNWLVRKMAEVAYVSTTTK